MRPVRAAAIALAFATSVAAQERSPTSGIPQPAGSFALTDDATFRSCTSGGRPCGVEHPDWAFTGEARLADGLQVVGQVGVTDAGNVSGQIGLQVDLAHLGVRSAASFPGAGGTGSQLTVLRLSSIEYPGLQIPGRRAVSLNLDRSLHRPSSGVVGVFLGQTHRDPLALTIEEMHRLALDPTVEAVVLRSGGLPLGGGRSEELQNGIEELRASGKKVVFYLEAAGDLDYSVASAADRVFAAPQAVLAVNGFSATAIFAGAGLDKLGVKAEFVRVGAYKTAPDLFTRRDMSGEQREVVNSILDDVFGRYVRRVTQARHLDEEKFRRLLDRGLQTPQEAQAQGLVDGLVYPDQLEAEVAKLTGGHVALEEVGTQPPSVRSPRWTPPPTVAVVRVEGTIARGEGGADPLGVVELSGSESIARRIHRLADDPSVKAIVLRVDSPGGDGSASDLIWRELRRARKEKGKPVVASMGDVAASGGYYVAVAADEIYAEPSTVTGSIGVFVGHFDASELFDKLGLNLVTLKRGASADLFHPNRSLTDAERRTLQTWVEGFYDDFLDRVAVGRNLTKPEVDDLGKGRVWTGAQALEKKLIDGFGGLDTAIALAMRYANVSDAEVDDEIDVEVDLSDFTGL